MIASEKNIETKPMSHKRKNVFSPAQVRQVGGLDAISEKFKQKRNKPLPDLGFTDNEWDLMLKNES